MLTGSPAAALVGALGLLERAIGYTRSSLQLATLDRMANPTPCQGWDLRFLLHHLDDSLVALQEAADVGFVGPERGGGSAHERADHGPADLVAALRARAGSLLGAWTHNDGAALVSVAGSPLTAAVLVSTGALEIAVHGWDVARACGHRHPLPPLLAEEMLDLAPLLVTDQDRCARFAAALELPPVAPPGDRLLAFLGRGP